MICEFCSLYYLFLFHSHPSLPPTKCTVSSTKKRWKQPANLHSDPRTSAIVNITSRVVGVETRPGALGEPRHVLCKLLLQAGPLVTFLPQNLVFSIQFKRQILASSSWSWTSAAMPLSPKPERWLTLEELLSFRRKAV